MKIRLLENEASIYEEAEKSSAVKTTYKKADILHVQAAGTGPAKEETWLKVRDETGSAGFMLASVKFEEVTVPRFRIERIAFITISAALAAVFVPMGGNSPPFGSASVSTFVVVAFMMGSFFVAADAVLGLRWARFFEQINEDDLPIPPWDWRRFVVEPLYLLAAVAGVFVVTGLAMLYQWLTRHH